MTSACSTASVCLCVCVSVSVPVCSVLCCTTATTAPRSGLRCPVLRANVQDRCAAGTHNCSLRNPTNYPRKIRLVLSHATQLLDTGRDGLWSQRVARECASAVEVFKRTTAAVWPAPSVKLILTAATRTTTVSMILDDFSTQAHRERMQAPVRSDEGRRQTLQDEGRRQTLYPELSCGCLQKLYACAYMHVHGALAPHLQGCNTDPVSSRL